MRSKLHIFVLLLLFAPASFAFADEADAEAERAQGTVNYELRIIELDDRVNSFRDEVFRARARLFLLREQVLHDRVGGARLEIAHRNNLRRVFEVAEVTYSVDGVVAFRADSEDGIDGVGHQVVWEQGVSAGPHAVTASVELRGRGFGIFSYMRGYSFRMESYYGVTVEEGRTLRLTIALIEEGGVNTPLEERPAIHFSTETRDTFERAADPDVALQANP